MASSMYESILGMVSPEMKQSMAARLGESPQAVQSGLGAATAATISGLANNASNPSFGDQIMQVVGRAGSQNLHGDVASLASAGQSGVAGDLISRFQSLVFGSHQDQVAGLVAQHAGLSSGSGSGMLKMATPLVLAYLAKLHSSGSLTASNFGGSLKQEASNLSSYAPASFLHSVNGAIGEPASRAAGVATGTAEAVNRSARTTEIRAVNRSRWAVPAAIAAVLLVGWLVIRAMHVSRPTGRTADTAANSVGSNVPASWAELGNPVQTKLPDGTVLNVPQNGVEVRLINYLQGATVPVGQLTGFDFDRLQFDQGAASLQPISYDQLNNIAAILKAYPTAKIVLGGYTDNTGDAAANQKVSEERATVVMGELTRRGVDPARLVAKGYGDANPVADNSTEAGRQQNRRVSIRVASK